MKQQIFRSLLVMFIGAGFLISCKSRSLAPLASSYMRVEPQPLELISGKVPVTVNMTFPPNWFDKNLSLTVTPVLRYEERETQGRSYNYQGEKVAGNGQVIPQNNGSNVTIKSDFNYIPDMQNAQLYLVFKAKKENKSFNLPDIMLTEGVLATVNLLSVASEPLAFASDKFQRVIKEIYNANIMFLIQQAELRSSELNKEELSLWKNKVENAASTPNQSVDLEISSYASPEGGYELNEKLAANRENNTKQYLAKELQKLNINTSVTTRYTAEDWEGFKELVEKSNMQDKELILRVLSMYADSEQREREIKNISAVYSTLAEEILPQLRRSRLTANIESIGKTDEELLSLAHSNPKLLNVEELLYAAHLASSTQEKENFYRLATELFPEDPRGFNNQGVIEYMKGNPATAESFFNKANQLSGSLPEANFNLGLMALSKDEKEKAEQYFGNAAGVPELNNTLGYLAALDGRYAQSVQAYGNTISNNAAIVQILTKNYNKALATLNAVENPSAVTYYLKAIVGARTNNLNAITENLKKSIGLNPEMITQALKDVEFYKYAANSKFLNAVLR
jgi:Flp pilus assembly protein TadD